MKAVWALLLCCFSTHLALCEPAPVRIQGLYLGITAKEADEIQRKAGKVLVYGSGMYWYRVVPGPFAFSPMVVFSPEAQIRRIVGDELEIEGISYKVGDPPHLLKINIGLPSKETTFSKLGRRFHELIYTKYKLCIELDRDRQDRIVSFLLDQDDDALYFTRSQKELTALAKPWGSRLARGTNLSASIPPAKTLARPKVCYLGPRP